MDKLSELAGQLLDISRIAAGRLILALEQVDLGDVVRDVVARLCPKPACSTPVEVTQNRAVVGHWHRARVGQIASNLLSNALKCGTGKRIDVRVERAGPAVRLAVTDRGIGICPEDEERIFAPFQRGAGVRTAGGAGLGLWITRRLLESLGGTIHVESAPGQGSTFTVTLPVAPPAPV